MKKILLVLCFIVIGNTIFAGGNVNRKDINIKIDNKYNDLLLENKNLKKKNLELSLFVHDYRQEIEKLKNQKQTVIEKIVYQDRLVPIEPLIERNLFNWHSFYAIYNI